MGADSATYSKQAAVIMSGGQHKAATLQQYYVSSVVVILLLTAVLKLASAFGVARILSTADPLLPFLSARMVSLLAAAVEFGAVAFILLSQTVAARLLMISWLFCLFVAYRAGLYVIGYRGYCSCLGRLMDFLPLRDQTLSVISLGLVSYLGIAVVMMIYGRRQPVVVFPR